MLVAMLILVTAGLGFCLIYLFFMINKIEKRIATTLQDVEVFLLNQYGEMTQGSVKEVDLEEGLEEEEED